MSERPTVDRNAPVSVDMLLRYTYACEDYMDAIEGELRTAREALIRSAIRLDGWEYGVKRGQDVYGPDIADLAKYCREAAPKEEAPVAGTTEASNAHRSE